MHVVASLPAAVPILFGSEAADGNAPNGAARPQPSHQVETAPIRQSNVADQQIEFLLGVHGDGGCHSSRDTDVVIVKRQKLGQRVGAVLMVLDEENASRWCLFTG